MIKQVILVRTDLRNKDGHKVRTGKIAAQVAHASMKVFFDRGKVVGRVDALCFECDITEEMTEWIEGIFTKICLRVNSEQELLDFYNKAQEAKLPCSLIKDAGLTEFNEPTFTCCAIGPDKSEKIDEITGGLKLL